MVRTTAWPLGLILVQLALADCQGRCASGAALLALKAETHGGASVKEEEFPINMTANSSNGTVDRELEMILGENAEKDMAEMNSIPNPENASGNSTHGMGELGRNLEFLMLKIVQLETVVELQQHEIQELRDVVAEHLEEDHEEPTASLEQVAPSARKEKAQEVLKKVMHKHNRQRETKDFRPEAVPAPAPAPPAEEGGSLLSKRAEATSSRRRGWPRRRRRFFSSVTSAVSSAANTVADTASDVAAAANDGTGLVGDALGDAYSAAENQVTFVANTVIDSVEMAVDILIRGFSDWNAGCPDTRMPSMSVDSNGMRVDWGRQKCWVRLMGQTCNLFDFNFGTVNLQWPEPLKTVVGFGIRPIRAMFDLGFDLVQCATSGSVLEVVKCLGMRLLEEVPPLSFLNRLGDMLSQFIEVFAAVATTVVRQVLEGGSSLIQQASQSTFPKAGHAPLIHHAGKSLTIKTHSQHHKSLRPKLKRELSGIQEAAREDPDPQGSIALSVSDQEGNYATRLITQWNGRETDTNSCLAFAPKNKNGVNQQATKADWQGSSADAFIPLEPFGVPCDNDWMKANWDKWQGYSFYTWEMSVEKCVSVTYSLGMQPVLAFVGGLEFELMPAPLAELDTVVCWPDKQPGGVDLSVLRSEIRSGGVMLFSRTLRLQKRFGDGTDFVDGNIFGAHESWRNPLGTAVGSHGNEDDRTVETMDRSLLQNASEEQHQEHQEQQKEPEKEPELVWQTDLEELYLATADYGKHLNISKTSEMKGSAVLEKMKALSAMQTEAGTHYHQLFSFKNPGMVSFEILGLLEDNSLELGMKLNFGPFESPEKRVPLLNVVDQFTLVLGAMPWVSADSRIKAIAALRDFGTQDVGAVTPEVPLPEMTPGSIIALFSDHWGRWMKMDDQGDMVRSSSVGYDNFPEGWTWEKFAVVDAGDGKIALHSLKFNRFVSLNGDGDLYASPHKAASHLPSGWTWQMFRPVYAGNGMIALHNAIHNRFIRMTGGTMDGSGVKGENDLPDDWHWERFRIHRTKWLLKPGNVVALHNAIHNRYISLSNDGTMYPSPERDYDEAFPSGWTWQKFTVVDGANGEVALHSAIHNRFWKMTSDAKMIGSASKAASDLPPFKEWTWERFAVVDAHGGNIALHNPLHNRFVSLSSTEVYASPTRNAHELPHGWTWQKFKVKLISEASSEASDMAWSYS